MDLPQHTDSRASCRPRSQRLTRVETLHQSIHQLFNGQSAVGTEPPVRIPATPKTPSLALDTIAASRFDLRPLSHTSPSPRYISPTIASISPTSPNERPSTNYRPLTPTTFSALQPHTSLAPPAPAWQNTHQHPQQFSGVDPEEQELAASIARCQPQKWRQLKPRRQRKPRAQAKPHRACLPGIQNPRMRSKTIHCLISGSFLVTVLSIYLGIALSSHNISQEFHVLIILVIVTVTIFFSHSLIVLMELTALRRRSVHFIPNMDSMGVYPGGYAAPATPIRVVLGRDEEALSSERGGEGESGAPKLAPPPPAYGLWRESVRVDPDRIFWARNTDAAAPTTHSRQGSRGSATGAPRRPPSYVSDDGVEYVVEAAGRSVVAAADGPLPVHPSERGRADGAPMGV